MLRRKKRMTLKLCPWIEWGTFLGKHHAEKNHQKLVPGLFLILEYNSNQLLYARNFFKKNIF